jgi:hypothetical protein
MKYTIYEDPRTHAFALLALPNRFVDGDALPVSDVHRWFGSREEAIAALPDLLNREEPDNPPKSDGPDPRANTAEVFGLIGGPRVSWSR